MKIGLTLSLLALCVVCSSSVSYANWDKVRDMVLQGEKISDKKKQEDIYRQAYALAQSSAAKNPTVSNEFLWLANAAGRLALVAPTNERIKLSKVVKDNAEKAIALDPKNGLAYMTLGAWHFYVADLSWVQKSAVKAFYGGLPNASYEKSVEYLTKALQYGAENPVEVYFIRAHAHLELDHDNAAIEDFKKCSQAVARNPREKRLQQKALEQLD